MPALVGQFALDGELRDWDVAVKGAAEVGAANGKIFAAVPLIKIEVLTVHISEATRTATAEIIVHVNNDAKETLKVADVITFTEDGKIASVRAYKG